MSATPKHLRLITSSEAEILELRLRALDRFYLRYRSKDSRRTMMSALRRIAREYSEGKHDETTFPWELIITDLLAEQVLSKAGEGKSKRTISRDAAALRGLLRCMKHVGAITREEAFDALGFRPPVTKQQLTGEAGRHLSDEDIRKVVRVVAIQDNKSLSARDTALLFVAASSGMRRAELSALTWKHVYLEEKRVRVIDGKGGRDRDAWLHPTAVQALYEWRKLRGDKGGAVFNPVDRFGTINTNKALSEHQIWKRCQSWAREAGISSFTPHDLRRFVVSNLLTTHDISTVAKVVGHAYVSTTAKYDRRPDEIARAAVSSLPFTVLAADAGDGDLSS